MSDQTPAPDAAPIEKPKSKLPMIILAVVGLLVGVGGGAALAVPLFAKAQHPPAATKKKAASDEEHAEDEESEEGSEEDGSDEEGSEEEGEEGEPRTPKPAAATYTVDNLVLNPAGSNGLRFLMITATLELKKAGQDEALKARDAELRDRLVALYSSKTVEQLADMAGRDSLKAETMRAVAPLLPKKAVRKVHFPQFVIQ